MSMSVGSSDGEAEDEVIATINTTPLVDVMLVLLIIFLITLRVVLQEVPIALPKVSNQATVTKPENVNIAVDKEGRVYWNNQPLADAETLLNKLKEVGVMKPQPEIHIKGDKKARYEFVGRVIAKCQQAGIAKVGFITDPERGG